MTTSLNRQAATVDPDRWPDVVALPAASALRTATARFLVRRALAVLPLSTALGGCETIGAGGPELHVHDPQPFFHRIGAGGLIGFGESYMAGEWDAPDLVAVLTVLARHAADLVPQPLQRLRGLCVPRQPTDQRNTPEGARANIRRHYDLSNELFGLFLDESLTYSCAVFPRLPARWSALKAAQHRKIDQLLDLTGVKAGTELLEIGTGWGELALRAARRGAHVTSLTLSARQQALAEARIAAAGLSDRARVELCDYRQARGRYEAVVSVEMIEAVGQEFWPEYFAVLEGRLRPGGRAAVQAITMPHDRMLASRSTHTWIQKYVFPGGQLLSTEAVQQLVTGYTRLKPAHQAGYGAHYAETLRLWRERFTARSAEVEALGFDETFRRMWTLYLAYSEAGFRAGYLDVQQFLLVKEDT
ncbi:class I SAM-dependent methyltransferase [Streptomyces sp. NPDC006879]|uniref:class I SAM-dependent methyltransferase n=1 Tax=Streptomyces sp. NPDC006879 TaxID=3364767 RepID=UPI0036D1E1EE